MTKHCTCGHTEAEHSMESGCFMPKFRCDMCQRTCIYVECDQDSTFWVCKKHYLEKQKGKTDG